MSTQRDPIMLAVLAVAVISLVFGVMSMNRTPSVTVNSASPAKTIRVRGTSTLDVKPDTATITLGMRVQRGTAKEAQAAGAAIINDVVAALKKLGIPESDIRSSRVSLNTVYDYRGTPKIVGYASESLLTITTQKLDQVGEIVDEAVKAGANEVQSVAFSLKDTEKAKQQAIDLAVEDAHKKAEQIAARTNQEITGVQSVSVDEQAGEPPIVYRAAKALESAQPAPMPVLPGTLKFSVAVEASYLIK
ncbi:MAG: SIMPL domain-containing protein [Firmicutes bacterium]|nr:SIMPL domain-containing protein [Bacillota bacterium]